MSTVNSYLPLTDFKNWLATRGLAGAVGTDTSDDAVIEDLLEGASRYLDAETGCMFFPRVETRYHDVPDSETYDPRLLYMDDDLLEITTLTNGDNTIVPSTEYDLWPKNTTPHLGIRLKDTSTYQWVSDTTGNYKFVISVLGWWGNRKQYAQRGWLSGGTLGAAITDATTLAFTMITGHSLVAGQIIKIDSEIYNIASISTNTITPIKRGDNGSTAATHADGATVYIWQPNEDVKTAILQIVGNVYANRSGQASSGRISVTASGVVIRPEDVPPMAQKIIERYRRIT